MRKANLIVAFIFSLLGAFIIARTYSFQQTLITDNFLGATFFPRFVAYTMIGLAVLLFIQTLRHPPQKGETGLSELFDSRIRVPMAALVIISIYVAVLKPLGFIISTILLNVAIFWLFRARTLLYLTVIPLTITLTVYLVFYKLLVVPLPEGLFYF
jgi:hypothetical protein